MKASPATIASMAADMKTVLGALPEGSRRAFEDHATVKTGDLWNLWHWVCFDRRNEAHPAYDAGRQRILPFARFDFQMYPDDMNDNTMATALRAAFKRAKG